ncbi:MAG: metallophosphoesterase family protein [Candidatus Micrarchaeota archaeon]|nr:metallophosphoesterase family protein [Candidatus Micrarchaeota archaeon]
MKILIVCDLHGSIEALERIRKADYGALIIAGDLQYPEYAKEVAKLRDLYFIPGNMDMPVLEIMKEKDIHGKTILLGKIKVAGFGFASPGPFHTEGEIEEKEIEDGLSKLDVDSNTLLVTHSPPYGIFDEVGGGHAGSTAIREFVFSRSPFMHAFGHIHEIEGSERIEGIEFIKLPPAKMLRGVWLDDETREFRFADL